MLEVFLGPRDILKRSADFGVHRYEDYPQMGRYVYVRYLIFLLRLITISRDLSLEQRITCHLSNHLIA